MFSSTAFVVLGLLGVASADGEADGKSYWMRQAQQTLQDALSLKLNVGLAKNVILFLGDGMGVSTVTAARIYKGQKSGHPGEETKLHMETFPHVAMSKTYNTDKQTADSAGSGTAFLCGVKANEGTLGVDSRVTRGDCSLMDNQDVVVQSILQWSHLVGKSVGVVSNARITHATPAAAYAVTPNRDWESDTSMPDNCPSVRDIAYQLVKNNSHIQVILGGGKRSFHNRKDNRTLHHEWLSDLQARNLRAKYVENAAQFRAVSARDTEYLLGLFADSHMSYELDRDSEKEPSMTEMTRKAIEILSKNDKGFFLFVEAGRIDHAHHQNWAKRAMEETVAFDDAIATADTQTGDDTLIVVTADHSHVFNIGGYPDRGNDILGMSKGRVTRDGMPFTTLVYGNGPGPDRTQDLTGVNTTTKEFRYQVAVPMFEHGETHAGEDVGIYAQGPMAHLFHGVHEQNYIAHVMAYAACVGPNTAHCDSSPNTNPPGCTGGVGERKMDGRWLVCGW